MRISSLAIRDRFLCRRKNIDLRKTCPWDREYGSILCDLFKKKRESMCAGLIPIWFIVRNRTAFDSDRHFILTARICVGRGKAKVQRWEWWRHGFPKSAF